MSIKICCDGCDATCQETDLTTVGLLEPVQYCADCLTTWRDTERKITTARVEVVKAFEVARSGLLAEVRGSHLRKLPDE